MTRAFIQGPRGNQEYNTRKKPRNRVADAPRAFTNPLCGLYISVPISRREIGLHNALSK